MLGMKEAYLNIIKAICKQAFSHHHAKWSKTQSSPAKIRNKVRVSTLSTSPKYITWSLGAIEWEGNKMDTKEVKVSLLKIIEFYT